MNDIEQTKARIERLLEEIGRSSGQRELEEARRKDWRYTWAVPATVQVVDSDDSQGSSEPLYVTTHNISTENMDFYSPQELDLGCKVIVTLQTEEGQLSIPGTVLHSISSVGKPLVAVTFDLDE